MDERGVDSRLLITHAFIILIGVRESGKARFRTSHAHMALVNLSAVDFQRADFRFNNLTIYHYSGDKGIGV